MPQPRTNTKMGNYGGGSTIGNAEREDELDKMVNDLLKKDNGIKNNNNRGNSVSNNYYPN